MLQAAFRVPGPEAWRAKPLLNADCAILMPSERPISFGCFVEQNCTNWSCTGAQSHLRNSANPAAKREQQFEAIGVVKTHPSVTGLVWIER